MSAEILDKLYSRFISTNRQVVHHPIIDLMLIRNDKAFLSKIPEDCNEFLFFSKLPLLDNNQLQDLHKNLLEKSLIESFKGEFESIFAFDSTFFQNILILRPQAQTNDNGSLQYLLIALFFCWLEFMLDSAKNTQALSFNSMDLFIREIENYGSLSSPFSSIESYLFSRFIELFIKCNTFKFDNESLKLISHHVKIDEALDHEFSPIFLQLIQKVSDGLYPSPSISKSIIGNKDKSSASHITSEGANSVLESLNIAIEYKRKSLSPNDFQKLAVILVPLIDNLNINAINIISNLSSTITDLQYSEFTGEKEVKGNHPSLKDSFILLPPLLLKKLQREKEGPFITDDDFPHFQERLYKIDLSDVNDSDQIKWHFSENQYALENGFNPISVEPPSPLNDLLPREFSKFLLSFSNALKKANGNCIDNFFMAMFKLLDALEKTNQLYYELYVSALFLATSCVEKISLMSLIEMFNKKTIFYPELTIFDNKIGDGPNYDSKVRSIRFHVLNLFACQMDQLIPDFLKDTFEYPFLFAEELAFVSNVTHMNLEVFMTKDFVVSIFTVIKSLLNDYFKEENQIKKDRIFLALQTVLSFLFKLLANKTIENQYFLSNYFISNFYSLVFVDFLKPFILMTMSNFLLNLQPDYSQNYEIIGTITSYFTNLYMKLNDITVNNHQQIDLIIDITNNLLTALSMNMKLSKFFSNVLDSFLELKLNFHEHLPLGLRFLSLVSSNSSNSLNKRMNNNINCVDETKLTSKQLRLVIYLIKKIEGNNPSQATKLSLMNLCAASVALGIDSLFLILRPSMIPLLFIAYGESDQLNDVLNMVNELCDFSETNCIAVHESGLDYILLEFIYNFMIKKDRAVNFRGIQFTLNFNETDIFNSIFPFLEKIFTVSANNVDISLLNNLICNFDNPNLCDTVSSLILRLLLKQKTKVSPTFPLGFKQSPLTMTKVSPNVINVSFSFITWIKIDRPISLQMSKSVPIITITDKSHHNRTSNINNSQATNVFSLFINRGCLYYQFNDRLELINQQIPSNTWIFIGFVCQRTTQQLSCIGLFTELSMLYCDDVPCVFFPKESSLTITIGGTFQLEETSDQVQLNENNENKLAVMMGPFALFNKMLDDSVFESIEKQGPSAIDDLSLDGENKNLIFNSVNYGNNVHVCDEYKSTVKIENKTVPYYFNLCQKSFEKSFCMNEQNLIKLIEVFIRYNEAPLNLINLILAIMKQTFDSNNESQQSFSSNFAILKHYLMKQAKENATFRLYKIFYSIFEVMKNNESMNLMFDNLLVNVELYSKGPPSSFERIVKHWRTSLLNLYPSLFNRKNFFNRLVKMYVYLFNKKPFDDRYNDEIINRIRLSFCSLLEEASKLGLTKENILYFENFINIQTDNEKNLFTFLSILEQNIGIVNVNVDYQLTLHHFAENENSEISHLAIISIHELTKPNWMKPMMALALQLKAKINQSKNEANMKNSLIKFLMDKAPRYPGFIHLITAITTSFENEEKKKVADKLKDIFCSNLNLGSSKQEENALFEDVVKDKFWFIWLLIAAIHSEGSAQLTFLTIISSFLCYVDDLYSEMNKIVNVLQIFEAVDKTFDYYQIVLDLFININAINISYSKFLIIPLLRALFFKFNDVTYSKEIIQLFLSGPFKNEYSKFSKKLNITFNNYDNNDHPKYDILSLEPLLVQDYQDYKLNFAYSVDAGNSKSESKLGHFLIQLVDSCKEVQFNKLTPNQYISNFLNNNTNNNNSSTVNNNNNDNVINITQNNNNTVNNNNNGLVNDDAPSIQTANDISYLLALLNGFNLLEYVHLMIDVDENQTEINKIEQMNNFTNIMPKVQKKFNNRFLSQIFDNIAEIKIIIKDIKSLVFVDFESVKQNSLENLKNSDYVSQFAKKVTTLEAKKFASYFIKYNGSNSKRNQCRQSNLSLVYCPFKMEIEPERLDIDEFFKTTNKRALNSSNFSSNQEASFKAKFHEFGNEKEVDFIIQNETIKIYDNNLIKLSLLKTISFNKVDFIITREKGCIEIFTNQNGSFFIEFKDNQDFVKCSFVLSAYFAPLNKFVNNESQSNQSKNSKILTSILSELIELKSAPLTNFEYLMMLNYFSGFSFHKSGKIPRLPLNGQPLSAQRFFLPEFFISKVMSNSSSEVDSSCADPTYVYAIRHQLEEGDVQAIAKKKYRFYVPKLNNIVPSEGPITTQCYRDLKLEQGTIIGGGFIEQFNTKSRDFSVDLNDENGGLGGFPLKNNQLIFIITKAGEVHFVEILRNKLKHIKSFTSHFLQENITFIDNDTIENKNNGKTDNNMVAIINSGDGFLAVSNKMIQRFTPSYESQIAETTMEPPLISISGREIVFVSNGCDVKKCVKQKSNVNPNTVQSISSSNTFLNITANSNSNSSQQPNSPLSKISSSSIATYNSNPQKKLYHNQQEQGLLFEPISTSDSKITCITCSIKYNIVVYGTEKCQLYVFSMSSEKVLHSIIDIFDKNLKSSQKVDNCEYVGNEPQKVLVTFGWGFIVTEAQKKIFVHTINGTFVGLIQIENMIVDWCSATNSRGEDFVIFIDTESRIGIFEAAKFEKDGSCVIKFIKGQPGTIALTYNSEFQCIVMLARKDGILTLYPMSLDNFSLN